MAKEKFSLANSLRNTIGSASVANMGVSDAVSNSDTTREQIEYIDIDQLVADEKNFYSLDGIEELAANIELCGLQQPLRVRLRHPVQGTQSGYLVVSGHRRRAALELLVKEGKTQFQSVPCIVERGDVSPALQELRLIYANSDTRRMNDADIAKQAERVTELFYQLKEEGFEFPGRLRDHVAEACKISTTKYAQLKVIREKLPEQYRAEFESGKMSTDAAYKLAKAPAELQERICRAYKKAPEAIKVDHLLEIHEKRRKGCMWEPSFKCPDGSDCSHGDAFLRHDATCWRGDQCGGKTCCLKCDQATRDWSPCGSACAQAKKLRAEKIKEMNVQQEKASRNEQNKRWKQIGKSARRLLLAVEAAGLDDKAKLPLRILGKRLTVDDLRKIAGGGDTDFDISKIYWNPMEFNVTVECRELHDLLGCSYDFLLSATNDPTPAGGEHVSKSDTAAPTWRTGEPEKAGRYWCDFIDPLIHLQTKWLAYWSGTFWYKEEGGERLRDGVLAWYPLPEV